MNRLIDRRIDREKEIKRDRERKQEKHSHERKKELQSTERQGDSRRLYHASKMTYTFIVFLT